MLAGPLSAPLPISSPHHPPSLRAEPMDHTFPPSLSALGLAVSLAVLAHSAPPWSPGGTALCLNYLTNESLWEACWCHALAATRSEVSKNAHSLRLRHTIQGKHTISQTHSKRQTRTHVRSLARSRAHTQAFTPCAPAKWEITWRQAAPVPFSDTDDTF